MQIKINKTGQIEIYRQGVFKNQYCCFVTEHGPYTKYCDDNCPMFGEPILIDEGKRVEMEICNKTFNVSLDDFNDNREYAKKPDCPF